MAVSRPTGLTGAHLGASIGHMTTADEMYEDMLDRTTVGDVLEQGNGISLWCRTCGYEGGQTASLDYDRLLQLPADLTLRALTQRASFKCGHRGAWLDTRRDPRNLLRPQGSASDS